MPGDHSAIKTWHFTLGGKQTTLNAGESHTETVSGKPIITFDRGGTFGAAKYSLVAGVFQFKVTDNGWDLHRKLFKVTLSNADSDQDFYFLRDGKDDSVAAGKSKVLNSSKPIEVVFDRGDGGKPGRKRLESGTYVVGIDFDKRRIDLYSQDAITGKSLDRFDSNDTAFVQD